MAQRAYLAMQGSLRGYLELLGKVEHIGTDLFFRINRHRDQGIKNGSFNFNSGISLGFFFDYQKVELNDLQGLW